MNVSVNLFNTQLAHFLMIMGHVHVEILPRTTSLITNVILILFMTF